MKPGIVRWHVLDPKADEFHWVSPYNYAENSPISNLDWWGLQKVFFMKGMKSKPTIMKAYNAARYTTAGKEFMSHLTEKNQNRIDVVYFDMDRSYISGWGFKFTTYEEFKGKKYPYAGYAKGDYSGLDENWVEKYFNDNPEKELIVIGIDFEEELSEEGILNNAESIVHEEWAHARDYFTGEDDTMEEDHKQYHGRETFSSPNINDIENDPKYENTVASKALKEIREWIEKNKGK